MRTTTRSTILTTISVAVAGLMLTACGPDRGESESPNTEDDNATVATAPTETMEPTPAIPTNASIQAYCNAFKGSDATFAGVNTTGEAADAFEEVLEEQRKVGTPTTMPQETRQVFIDHLQNGADFVAALRKLPEDSPVSAMRTNKEFYEDWGGRLETPEELTEYSAKNCA
jgi:hypothetical protein